MKTHRQVAIYLLTLAVTFFCLSLYTLEHGNIRVAFDLMVVAWVLGPLLVTVVHRDFDRKVERMKRAVDAYLEDLKARPEYHAKRILLDKYGIN